LFDSAAVIADHFRVNKRKGIFEMDKTKLKFTFVKPLPSAKDALANLGATDVKVRGNQVSADVPTLRLSQAIMKLLPDLRRVKRI
jgi:hypothetical protein